MHTLRPFLNRRLIACTLAALSASAFPVAAQTVLTQPQIDGIQLAQSRESLDRLRELRELRLEREREHQRAKGQAGSRRDGDGRRAKHRAHQRAAWSCAHDYGERGNRCFMAFTV